MFKLFSGLLDSNDKEIRRIQPLVDKINELEPEFQGLTDEQLKNKTVLFKARLVEATSRPRRPVEEARQDLAQSRKRLSECQTDMQRDDLGRECKEIEERVNGLDKELQAAENKALTDLLPEAFAAVREAARRTIGQRHFDVQLVGGAVLHQGKIAEMKTGEGKTLTATLALYLNSLTGRGCHLVTVNDYLAKRDAHWMGPVYNALGVTVATVYSQTPDNQAPSFVFDADYVSEDPRWLRLRPVTRREAYNADITYGTNNEFGFDYLRDNMVVDLSQCVQRDMNYAIVDEVDNLLIDEARTPLIISGPAEDTGPIYAAVNSVVARMKNHILPNEPVRPEEKEREASIEDQFDYIGYEKGHNIKETIHAQEKLARGFGLTVEQLFGGEGGTEDETVSIEEAKKRQTIRSIARNAMIAHAFYHKDREYVVKDNEVIIVDEFTGRLMYGRRYSEGLHQAIEAKEGVKVQRESMTYATITFQNYFRMYKKLAGMTGTALTEAEEFHKIYKLDVVAVPTNREMVREDLPDRIYKNEKAKFRAVADEIEHFHKEGRPVLVGTVSIENSEYLSDLLMRKGVQHNVLNAKLHEKEAGIIAEAGKPGVVTVATNMAGRGVDIILGGKEPEKGTTEHETWAKDHEKVLAIGGMHIIGTERHEARRIDNQLRGRAGRQGDPGSTRFYISLEDDVMRRFGGDRVKTVLGWAGLDEETPIENRLINRTIENAQVRVEGYHFDMRKHLVEYDDVVNKHRELIYGERRKILSGADLKANILDLVHREISRLVATQLKYEPEEQDYQSLLRQVGAIYPLPRELTTDELKKLSPPEIESRLIEIADALYDEHENRVGPDSMRILERLVMLRVIDSLWVEHLTAMEDMRLGIGLEAVGQRDPLVAYKNRGHELFQTLMETIQHDVVHTIYHVEIKKEPVRQPTSAMAKASGRENINRKQVKPGKVGRNDPCPCGSGKKYKHCCGK